MNEQTPISTRDPTVTKALELDRTAPWWHRHRILLALSAILTVAVAAVLSYLFRPEQIAYLSVPAERNTLQVHVSATGALNPLNEIEVGVEISGTLVEVLADFNDQVRAGDVLARIDTERLEAQRRQSLASLEQARASLNDAKAAAQETAGNYKRARELHTRGFVSDQALESANAAHVRATAAIEGARARVNLAEAALQSDETSLSKAIIRAPIDGIVLSRNVEPGQTLAATFQTPVLFNLAEDLSKMELYVEIDEADIGTVEEEQGATFTVDAYPGRQFHARIVSVRNAPRTVQGVVTYEAILLVENPDFSLKPGMTATVEILVNELDDALVVPAAALRFAPDGEEPQPPEPYADGSGRSEAQLYVETTSGKLERRDVVSGLTDGTHTAIVSGALREGEAVIYDIARDNAAGAAR